MEQPKIISQKDSVETVDGSVKTKLPETPINSIFILFVNLPNLGALNIIKYEMPETESIIYLGIIVSRHLHLKKVI